MRCFFICMLLLFACSVLAGQKVKKQEADSDKVFTKIEINATTDAAVWAAYLKKSCPLPDSVTAQMPAGTYRIYVQFVIDRYGNLGGAKALNNPGYGLANKAEKIISRYEGVWTPANQCGRPVTSYKTEMVTFLVNR